MGTKPVKTGEDTYEERFIRKLNSENKHDETCLRIAANRGFAGYCGTMLRRYVDPEFTKALSAERKARVGAYRANLVKAIDGLEAAAALYRHRDAEKAASFESEAAKLRAELPGADELLDTQRHGKVRDHGILDCAKKEIEKTLGPITNRTLANLVNAAIEAHGIYQEPVDEDMIRRNLANFRERNVNWDPTGN